MRGPTRQTGKSTPKPNEESTKSREETDTMNGHKIRGLTTTPREGANTTETTITKGRDIRAETS